MFIIVLLAIIGFSVSLYGFFVERQLKKNPSYKPICDISDQVSCSKPLASGYGKLFGISNAILGMLLYGGVGICALAGSYTIVLLISLAACAITIWLAFILFFKIKTICFVCIATYLVNIALLCASIYYWSE